MEENEEGKKEEDIVNVKSDETVKSTEDKSSIEINKEKPKTEETSDSTVNKTDVEVNKKKKRSFLDKILSAVLTLIYSKDKKIERYVIFLTMIGFFFRLIAALNLDVLADDMVHTFQSAGVLSAKILSTHSNPALFFYLNDLAFQIFGYTTFASRFFPLITGTLLIPLVFLITTKLFNNKNIGLLSAFFVTLSGFLIRNTFGEASLVVLFFSMFAVYLGMIFLETRKNIFIVLSGILFGLGVLTKYNAPFFLIGFLIYSVFYLKLRNEKVFNKKNINSLIIFAIVIFIFALPPLVFNYLIYKDLGIMDVYFSRMIQTEATQQLYGGLAGQGNSFFSNLFKLGNYGNAYLLFKADLILSLFSIIGLFFIFTKKKYSKLYFLIPLFIIPFILQSAGAPLPKHFVFMPFLLAIPAGYGLYFILNKINKRNVSLILILIIFILMIVNFGNSFSTPSNYLSPSATSQLKSYLNDNVQPGELIVFDSRIYSAQSFWLATPNNFLLDSRFAEFTNFLNTVPQEYVTGVSVYFVECGVDDCGWGTIASQPEFNASTEFFFSQVKNFSNLEIEISEPRFEGNEFYSNSEKKPVYKVYKQVIASNSQALDRFSSLNTFYFVPYLYEDLSNYVYNYKIHNSLDGLLEKTSYFVIILSMFFSILSFFYLFYLFSKS